MPADLGSDALNILFMGRMVKTKGPFMLLDAFDRLPEATRRLAGLQNVGAGPALAHLQDAVAGRSDVVVHGLVPEVRPFYGAADIFALPSEYEGLPLTLLEAMAANVPCVATRVGDVPERFSDCEHFLLTDIGDAAGFSGQLERLITDADLRRRLGANGCTLVDARYTWDEAAVQVEEEYAAAIARGVPK